MRSSNSSTLSPRTGATHGRVRSHHRSLDPRTWSDSAAAGQKLRFAWQSNGPCLAGMALLADESGQDMAEYALLMVMVGIAVMGGVSLLWVNFTNIWTQALCFVGGC